MGTTLRNGRKIETQEEEGNRIGVSVGDSSQPAPAFQNSAWVPRSKRRRRLLKKKKNFLACWIVKHQQQPRNIIVNRRSHRRHHPTSKQHTHTHMFVCIHTLSTDSPSFYASRLPGWTRHIFPPAEGFQKKLGLQTFPIYMCIEVKKYIYIYILEKRWGGLARSHTQRKPRQDRISRRRLIHSRHLSLCWKRSSATEKYK